MSSFTLLYNSHLYGIRYRSAPALFCPQCKYRWFDGPIEILPVLRHTATHINRGVGGAHIII